MLPKSPNGCSRTGTRRGCLLSATTEVPIAEASTLLDAFTSFLTVSIHTILYNRNIYPRDTFLSAKAFNLPVHQSRHPKVCSWINDAVDAVMAQLAKGTVERVAVVIHSPLKPPPAKVSVVRQLPPGSVLERWMFDVSRFPSWPGGIEALKSLRGEGEDHQQDENKQQHDDEDSEEGESVRATDDDNDDDNENPAATINWVDVDEQLRGAARRLAYAGEKMDALPEGCTFTVVVELRDKARAPIGYPQPWIPSQSGLKGATQNRGKVANAGGADTAAAATIPIRTIETGPLFLECWVEEGKAKDVLPMSESHKGPQSSE
ncbi:hypothetical protein M406DRAFT_97681 [Cryphonectria parasitica EP155]|uniref:HORMA domain-containing protein n=1 Tax=Cryphonectria parasitica (strain ATCC 38755 / EP155) TaxID=660469 RepID=A0A9P4Y518_CRYP1|nr:uncharacterized protein M406DRAFT_97681 [Cryphonectria parasitica EP155]KAF3766828.1 hypothetical protein M406DRAFT_97681 [Cryphonectria parasitica EP155]